MMEKLLQLADRMLDAVVPKTHAAAATCWYAECCHCTSSGCLAGEKYCCLHGCYSCQTFGWVSC